MTLEAFRARFPILRRRVYLNSCSQGALSLDVEGALRAFVETWHTDGSPWNRWVGEVERLRALFAASIGASPDEVAVMPNASTAIAAVATGLSFDGPRREVLLGAFEFPTMAHAWRAQARRGATIVTVGAPEDPALPVGVYEARLSERTRIVPVTHVCFRNGYRMDVPALVARAHDVGALVMLDDYQHTGTSPLDVRALGVDVLVTGTLKYLLGPPGVALLYVRRERIGELEPLVTGWFGRVDPFAFALDPLDWSPTARRFETGSPAVPNAYAAVAALELLQSVSAGVIEARIRSLVDRFDAAARERGFDVLTPHDPARRGPLAVVRALDAPMLVTRLAERGIVCSARGSGVRVAFHGYNDLGDVEAVIGALDGERRLLGDE